MGERWRWAVVRHPVRVILAWVATSMLLVGGSMLAFGPDGPGATARTSHADVLPGTYESAKAAKIAEEVFPEPREAVTSAVLVLSRRDGGRLGGADVARARTIVHDLGSARIRGVGAVAPSVTPSPNRTVVLAQVTFPKAAGTDQTDHAVTALRARATALTRGSPLRAGFTGEAAAATDSVFLNILVSGGMVGVIVLLLVIVFRGPWVALLTILIIALVGEGASAAIALAAGAMGARLDGSVTGLVPVVLFGVGTDYVVFLLFRYQERLRAGADRRTAMVDALGRVGAAIVVSALAVAVSFLALLLSGLSSFRVLGVALALAVVVMVFAGVTLVPAVFSLLGGRAFWPSRRWREEPAAGLAARTGARIARRPALVAAAAVAILAVSSLGALAYRASYDQSAMPPGSQAATALHRLESGFPAGTLSPAEVYLTGPGVTRRSAEAYAHRLTAVPIVGGIGGVRVHGQVAQVDLLLSANPDGERALDAMVEEVRPAAKRAAPAGTAAYVGGETSAYADVRDVVDADMKVIFPAAGVLILLVLLWTVRGVLAPAYLLVAVVGGFGATLGAAVLAFQVVGGASGVTFTLPLIVYMFVASIGTDYNILVIHRIREEMLGGRTPRAAVAEALRHAGRPVAAAGLILAGSFASLTVSPLLSQVGFAVTVGILVSTFVLSWLLVPALTALAGRRAFWPGPAA